jgi:anhydro-N-acetylmuramic acid kinase
MSSVYTVVGVMSGTSLDGLDIAICRFEEVSKRWAFEISHAKTIPYPEMWRDKLKNAHLVSGADLIHLHTSFGRYMGDQIAAFAEQCQVTPDLIASHGHTIFHQPSRSFTFQLGCGAALACTTGIDTVSDFRSSDVALAGQGAPLVPFGDQHLFGGHRYCLNLGGIANISFEKNNSRIAFDICAANMALNFLSMERNLPFDENGALAQQGNIIPEMLNQLNGLDFFSRKPPKSLGREWFESDIIPIIRNPSCSLEDRLRTVTEHIAIQVAASVAKDPGTTMLTTGGGAFNSLLVEVLGDHLSRLGIHVVVPDPVLVKYKEALIFAFLGINRALSRINTLASVTGAARDSIGGCIYKS